MRLHDNLPSGNGYKVRLLLAQLGIPFERVEYDIDKGETRPPVRYYTSSYRALQEILDLQERRNHAYLLANDEQIKVDNFVYIGSSSIEK